MLIEEIGNHITKGKDIEEVLEKYDWKKFEHIIGEIFQENGFRTKQNFRFKTKKRYEIDIIAIKNNLIFCVDCKWWNKGRYKKSGLKNAVILQENRGNELRKFLKKNIIAKNLLRINSNTVINSLLVTLHEEDIAKHNETFVVPVWKLNRFISEIEKYI